IFLSGGVAANKPLRKLLDAAAKKRGAKLYVADFKHNTDNAVMIAVGGYINFLKKKRLPLVAKGNMNV
ncbi:MAG: tRNA (adenosine(37)-N6)-threonylcarbamoyltransferase complex transferase subunit TsaD, partial [Patescibacteria group bacterium]